MMMDMLMTNDKINNNIELNKNKKKMNILFCTTSGIKINLVIDYGTSVGEVLRIYLTRIKRPELINSEAVTFVYNNKKLNFEDKTKIEDYFKCNEHPTIIVNFLK